MGIEPTPEAWEAAILPLNYTRFGSQSKRIIRDQGCCHPRQPKNTVYWTAI